MSAEPVEGDIVRVTFRKLPGDSIATIITGTAVRHPDPRLPGLWLYVPGTGKYISLGRRRRGTPDRAIEVAGRKERSEMNGPERLYSVRCTGCSWRSQELPLDDAMRASAGHRCKP